MTYTAHIADDNSVSLTAAGSGVMTVSRTVAQVALTKAEYDHLKQLVQTQDLYFDTVKQEIIAKKR